MATWFGQCNAATGADAGGSGGLTLGQETAWLAAGYVCPGSGSQDIVTIGMEMWYSATNNIRMGIYNASGDLVVQTDAKVANGGEEVWDDWAAGDLTWHIGTSLTGGATYRIVCAGQTGCSVFGVSLTSGDIQETSTDYTAGLPATLPAANDWTVSTNTHVLVEPAAAGGIVPQAMIMMMYRRMRA